MVMMSDLPHDLVEEVLSRVPLTSMKAVRFTCKTWNNLSNGRSFTKKHIGKAKAARKEAFQGIMVMESCRFYLVSFNLQGVESNVAPSIKREGTLVTLNDANHQVDILRVLNCDGLLLCITKDMNNSWSLVVWNPYSGQTMWIKHKYSYLAYDNYALGYESGKNNSLLNHKILRFKERICEFELYSFKSNSWKVLDVTPDWSIDLFHSGLSIKGNTYWYAKDKHKHKEPDDFLICFDFTSERFGPRLPLPFHSTSSGRTALSIVGEEELAVLFQSYSTCRMEIWVTSKIDPKEVSWNKFFLTVGMPHLLYCMEGFFIDLKNNAAVVLVKKYSGSVLSGTEYIVAYIIGKNGYLNQVHLGVVTDRPLMCSYVPSSVQIKHVTY